MCAKLPKNPRRSAGAYSTASSTAPPYSPPTPMPCSTRSVTSRTGAHQPIASYDGSSPIAAVPTPMITQREQQHLLAPDPVTEVPEDEPADRPGQEADGEGAEGRELRGRVRTGR